jgi:hypothetical protein
MKLETTTCFNNRFENIAMQSSLNIRYTKYVTGHHIRIACLFYFESHMLACNRQPVGSILDTVRNLKKAAVIRSDEECTLPLRDGADYVTNDFNIITESYSKTFQRKGQRRCKSQTCRPSHDIEYTLTQNVAFA